MTETSTQILARFHNYHSLDISLSLSESYLRLLERLGNPHLKLPPVIHAAGTNGKGSTLAFLRAMLEAEGKRVHVYTSPHLVRFHERIRAAGSLIEENALVKLLKECEAANAAGQVTFFELTTALAFLAFSRTPADYTLLETGMGGRLDATNVVPNPILSIITRISYDHREYLGESLSQIAGEKAGIFKKNTPVIVALQENREVIEALQEKAEATNTSLFLHSRDWHYTPAENGFTFHSSSFTRTFPKPALKGEHQLANAATAIAALTKIHLASPEAIQTGLQQAQWPARLQKLEQGPLIEILPKETELWLDGGHNDSAGTALAHMAEEWKKDGKPLFLLYGMLSSKDPVAFLRPLAPYAAGLTAIAIPEEPKSLSAEAAAMAAKTAGIPNVETSTSLVEAVTFCIQQTPKQPVRFLICGSLYLAGFVLRNHS